MPPAGAVHHRIRSSRGDAEDGRSVFDSGKGLRSPSKASRAEAIRRRVTPRRARSTGPKSISSENACYRKLTGAVETTLRLFFQSENFVEHLIVSSSPCASARKQ